MKRIMTIAFMFLLGGPLAAAPPTILAQGQPQPPASRFQPLPATPEPPEMTAQQREAEQALNGINQGRLSKQQLRQMLLNHPNQNIRAKAQQAAKGTPGAAIPAAPEPPQIQAQQQEAEQALKGIDQGRLSKQQLRQMLLNHPNPRIREKAQEAQRVKQQPRGSLDSQDLFTSLSSLWTYLNPWTVSEAQALGGYAVTLTPQRRLSAIPSAYLELVGARNGGGSTAFTTFFLGNSPSPFLGFTVTKPYARFVLNLTSPGWYLIDIYGYGKPSATLRKEAVGYPVLESWDMTASPTSYNHFATVEYLALGYNAFYFTIDTSSLWLYEVSAEGF